MEFKNFFFTFDPSKRGLRKILGDLETDIMEIVWENNTISVREVHGILHQKRQIAYTTVMTVMGRLADKGLLLKNKDGNAFVYEAACTKDDFEKSTVKKIITGLMEDFSAPAISQFIESFEGKKEEKIEELSRIIEQKRKGDDSSLA